MVTMTTLNAITFWLSLLKYISSYPLSVWIWFPYSRRRSRIADRKKFCDRLRWSCDRDHRRSQPSPAIVCDQLRLSDHMETKVLRSAIETYPIIFWIPTHDSTLLINKARIFVCSNRLFLLYMTSIEQGNVSNEAFMEEVVRYECVYHRNNKDFKNKNKKANCWEKSGRNLIYRRQRRRSNSAT